MDSIEQQKQLRRFFRQWYTQHQRSFPWRQPDVAPFGVLVAEMLLRQTRAEMVPEICIAFMARYPSADDIPATPVDKLREVLRPLGLGAQRATALHEMAAHAVTCFAFGRRVAVVDLNVIRVLARIRGEAVPHDNRRAPWTWTMARLERFLRSHVSGH
jgi:A/G-specific adenine glycosylase